MTMETTPETWRPFRVVRIVQESEVIRSFYFEPADGGGFDAHAAGQHLPIRLTIPGEEKPVLRTYTLSHAPSDSGYRISVKREGQASQFLHDRIRAGDVIEAKAPAGSFTIDPCAERPAVLLSGGVGVTPMLAMLRHIVHEGQRTGHYRPTWFIHAARTLGHRAFAEEVAGLVRAAGGAVRAVCVIGNPEAGARAGVDYDAQGHIDMALLKRTLPFDDFEFYLCGPGPFMQALYDGLRGLRVPDDHIFAEAFGPASLQRKPDGPAAAPAPKPAAGPVAVAFAHSGKEAQWSPGAGFLLDLAEQNGLTPEFGCRAGACGACHTRVLEGAVAYASPPGFAVEAGEALICCAMPAAREDGGGERLVLNL